MGPGGGHSGEAWPAGPVSSARHLFGEATSGQPPKAGQRHPSPLLRGEETPRMEMTGPELGSDAQGGLWNKSSGGSSIAIT